MEAIDVYFFRTKNRPITYEWINIHITDDKDVVFAYIVLCELI